MSILLDTHALLWWLSGDQLAGDATSRVASPDTLVVVSAATVWEAGVKASLGKLTLPAPLLDGVRAQRFELLGISAEHAERAARLPSHHRDPFDRMLVAQAQAERLTVMTRDPAFDLYDVPTTPC